MNLAIQNTRESLDTLKNEVIGLYKINDCFELVVDFDKDTSTIDTINITEFGEKSSGAYASAYSKGILNEICLHMVEVKKTRGHWNYENCKIEAKKYTSRSKFKSGSMGAFDSARKNNWLEEFFPK